MPIKSRRLYCITHPDTELQPSADFHFLPEVKLTQEWEINLSTRRGTPCKTFSCPECGYIELYLAQMIDEWKYDRLKPRCSRVHRNLG